MHSNVKSFSGAIWQECCWNTFRNILTRPFPLLHFHLTRFFPSSSLCVIAFSLFSLINRYFIRRSACSFVSSVVSLWTTLSSPSDRVAYTQIDTSIQWCDPVVCIRHRERDKNGVYSVHVCVSVCCWLLLRSVAKSPCIQCKCYVHFVLFLNRIHVTKCRHKIYLVYNRRKQHTSIRYMFLRVCIR